MPNFQIFLGDSRQIDKETRDGQKAKVQLKERSDFGLGAKENADDSRAGGATFDAKAFRGNAQLFIHFNEVALAKIGRKIPASESLKRKRKKKVTYGDDYNTALPEDVIAQNRKYREQDEISEESGSGDEPMIEEVKKKMDALLDVDRMLKASATGEKTSFLPGVDQQK